MSGICTLTNPLIVFSRLKSAHDITRLSRRCFWFIAFGNISFCTEEFSSTSWQLYIMFDIWVSFNLVFHRLNCEIFPWYDSAEEKSPPNESCSCPSTNAPFPISFERIIWNETYSFNMGFLVSWIFESLSIHWITFYYFSSRQVETLISY